MLSWTWDLRIIAIVLVGVLFVLGSMLRELVRIRICVENDLTPEVEEESNSDSR